MTGDNPVPAVKALACPGCGGAIELRAAGHSVSLVCGHCHATIDMTRDEPRLIAEAATALSAPWLPLGARGRFQDIDWEVVGYLERRSSHGSWSEYLLFNPYHGYRFLVDDDRSWSFGEVLDRTPAGRGTGWIELGERRFEQFDNAYRATVSFVVGEFYWRAAVGESVMIRDYVRPGTMISREESESGEDGDGEIGWTRLDILPRGTVEAAFGFVSRGPGSDIPSPHEPSPWKPLFKPALIVAAIACIGLIVGGSLGPSRTTIYDRAVQVPLDGPEKTVVIGPLSLPDRYAGVAVHAEAPTLDNSWVDLDYALVDRRTQQSYEGYGAAEYYHGADSDGSWTEGDTRPVTTLSSVPGGTYDLIVDLSAHRWGTVSSDQAYLDRMAGLFPSVQVPVRISVERGAGFGGNAVLALLLIAAWPIALLGLHARFEKMRRAQSGLIEAMTE